ncbi:MAG: hypothetical protein HOP19_27165 [Acidobacteria bacterium]|nr:hypothetical protein [Acidobacteriota bacterium]
MYEAPGGGVLMMTGAGWFVMRNGQFTAAGPPLAQVAAQGLRAATGSRWRLTSEAVLRAVRNQTHTARLREYWQDDPDSPGAFIAEGKLSFEDRQGNLWGSATPQELFRIKDGVLTRFGAEAGLTPVAATFPNQRPSFLRHAVEDRAGNLWFGTSNGLLRFRDGRFQRFTAQDGLPDSNIDSLLADREGNIWVGTPHGLARLTRQFIQTYSVADGLPTPIVYPLLEDRAGNVWIGTDRLSRYAQGRFTTYDHQAFWRRKHLYSLHESRNGGLWIGTLAETWQYKDGRFTQFPQRLFQTAAGRAVTPTCYAIHEDRAGNVWFGTDAGLFKLSGQVMTALGNEIAGDSVRVLFEDWQGRIWAGGNGGLAQQQGEGFRRFTPADGLPNGRVMALHESDDGVLWIGTYDSGLSRLKDGRFTNYTTEHGLFNNSVFTILADARGNLWMSCNKGIYRVSRAQLEDFAAGKIQSVNSTAYGNADGMRNAECNTGRTPTGIKTRDGRLWFPTQDGVAVVDPASMPFNEMPPTVVIESLALNHEAIASRAALQLEPGQENLEIGYAGLSFIKPDQVKFKYQMVGWDNDWVAAGTRRTAYYSYLRPGSYEFRVTAANSDGVWHLSGATMRVVVRAPFYRTWWFLALTVLSLGGLVWFAYRWRVTQLEKQSAAQEAFARKLIASQESERKRIAAELHDGLAQNLLVIQNYAVMGQAEKTTDAVQTRFAEIFTGIRATVQQSLDEVRTIAYNLRPLHLERLGLTATLNAMIEQLAESSGIEIKRDIAPLDDLFTPEAAMNLFRLVQESLNNLVRHSGARTARVSIVRHAARLDVTIQDDGQGFDADGVTNGLGLTGFAERVRLLGGTHQIQTALGQGTTVTLQIPVSSVVAQDGILCHISKTD